MCIRDRYQKNESKITFPDIADCLILVTNCFSTRTSYENQTKKSITNRFIREAMTDFFKEKLEIYFIENKAEADRIADQVLINKRSRKVEERELFIVEGKSAMGACIQARNPDFQAIIPVRGKILNCLKAEDNKIFKSDIITDLIKVLGCGVELGGKGKKDLSSFDIANLRWSKVIICTDADVDGYQIRTLILTMIYRLVPSLIEEGYVYIAESPLYEIESKGKTYFAYTEPEKAEFLKRIGGAKYTIQRSKGLGENDAEMMWLTTMNPETRRLIRVMPEDAERTGEIFDLLLGDNLAGRKQHISEFGSQYLDLADIS